MMFIYFSGFIIFFLYYGWGILQTEEKMYILDYFLWLLLSMFSWFNIVIIAFLWWFFNSGKQDD